MAYVQDTIRCGNVIEVEKHHTSTYLKKGMRRSKREKKTSEQQEKVNERNAIKKLRRLINTNFKEGDWHIVLTYNDHYLPESKKQAKKDLDNFMQRLKRYYKKIGNAFKYITVTEYKNVRIHHHIVIDQADAREITKQWRKGRINFKPLDSEGNNHYKLAEYLIKETRTTFRSKERVYGKRWNQSKNLEQPIVERKIVKSNSWRDAPAVIKGYYLDKDSVVQGISEITGYPYQYYTLIKLKEDKHGKAGKTKSKSTKETAHKRHGTNNKRRTKSSRT